jgi:hypothetical protein
MKFVIEQLAICPTDPLAARDLLSAMGAQIWVHDHVHAKGTVIGAAAHNEADLDYNYELNHIDKPLEFEILHYTWGANWMEGFRANSVSHLGMHTTSEDLELWRKFFNERSIYPVQEVQTVQHTNPAIAGLRTYQYVIFGTRHILGVDLKFIVRQVKP